MDAVEFIKAIDRLCKAQKDCCDCPLREHACDENVSTIMKHYDVESVQKMVQICEQWAKDHPVKTRQSEFLKMFPNAVIKNGAIAICPRNVCESYTPEDGCIYTACGLCRKRFWLAEVTDND